MKFNVNLRASFFFHRIMNFLWYLFLISSVVILFTILLFNISTYSGWKIHFPSTTFRINNYSYTFNEEYVEVIRMDRVVREYLGQKFQQEYARTIWKEPIKSLYNVDAEKLYVPGVNISVYPISGKIDQYDILYNFLPAVNYIPHRYIPSFSIGASIYLLFLIFVMLITLFNLKRIFETSYTKTIFNKDNVMRLKVIAVYLVLAELMKLLIYYWMNNALGRMVYVSSDTMSGKFNFTLSWSDVNFGILFSSLIIFLLARIIQSGVVIKEENELTI